MAATLADGQTVEVPGSGSAVYTLERKGRVYACTCPAWRNQSRNIDVRTCKHLRAYLGEDVEAKRVGANGVQAAGGAPAASAAPKGKAPPILLAHKWELHVAPDGWWMSEKLDGIRAYWDGTAFVSRLGNRFDAPPWFTAALPSEILDGELWVGRKQFQRTTSIVRSTGAGDEWKQLAYVVFDAPAAKGPFEARGERVRELFAKRRPPHAVWHEHVRCEGVDHLKQELARVESLGGEGLMLRRPGSAYEIGRSSSLLKVKTFHDAEARVIGYSAGAGKHKGRVGALEVELPDGTRFSVGTGLSDAERDAPPPIGAVITFRYQELSDDGVPRFPTYVGVRVDVELPKAKQAPKPAAKPEPKPAKATPKQAAIAPQPPAPAPKPAAVPAPTIGNALRLEIPGQKFWSIEVRGKRHYTTFGKVGSDGQTRLVEFDSEAAAQADADKRAAAKRKEGYR